MQKYFPFILLSLALALPSISAAAFNDVSLGASVNVRISGFTLNVSGSPEDIQSINILPASFTVTLLPGSYFSVTSVDKKNLVVTGIAAADYTKTCDASSSSLTIMSPSASETATISISGDCGGAPTPPPPASTPVAPSSGSISIPASTPSVTTTVTTSNSSTYASGLTEAQVQSIFILLTAFGVDQVTIDKVMSALRGTSVTTVNFVALAERILVNLSRGSRGPAVVNLQDFLVRGLLMVFPTGVAPGFYGTITEQAVKDFQCKFNIVCSGSPASTGWGVTGPRTRAAINRLLP